MEGCFPEAIQTNWIETMIRDTKNAIAEKWLFVSITPPQALDLFCVGMVITNLAQRCPGKIMYRRKCEKWNFLPINFFSFHVIDRDLEYRINLF